MYYISLCGLTWSSVLYHCMFVQGNVEQFQSCTERLAMFQPFPANGLKQSALKGTAMFPQYCCCY